MSPNKNANAPNEGYDETVQIDEKADSEPAALDWNESRAAMQKISERRETRRYATDAGVMVFEIRALTADENDEVERIAASQQTQAKRRNRNADVGDDFELWPVKRTVLQYGIVRGPDGFDPAREDHLRQLSASVQEDLFLAIDELGELDVEVEKGFRAMG